MPLAWSQQAGVLCWLATDGCGTSRPTIRSNFRKTSSSVHQLLGRRNAGRPGTRTGRQAGSHRHRALPGGASAGQGSLGPALRGSVSLVRALLQPARPAGSRARVSAGGRGVGPARGFSALRGQRGKRRSAATCWASTRRPAIASRSTIRGPARSNSRAWQQNEATIIHEATHQMAFNTGVHNRFAPTPVWLAEGLGTMFEAPGVWDWRNHPDRSERINRGRLAQFRQWRHTGGKTGAFRQPAGFRPPVPDQSVGRLCRGLGLGVLSHRNLSRRNLPNTCSGSPTGRISRTIRSARRISDFTTVFGDDLRMLEKHFLRSSTSCLEPARCGARWRDRAL